MSRIVSFYRLEAPDSLGRWLRDIWEWDVERLESVHNYIQFLFPNWEPGVFASAPLLDEQTVAAFHADATLRDNLARSHDVMLEFFGLKCVPETGDIVPAENFADRADNWLRPHNHNHLRITRILICLVALGLPERARAFFRCLTQLRQQYPKRISAESFAFWKAAVEEED
jgi:hypothetical protein